MCLILFFITKLPMVSIDKFEQNLLPWANINWAYDYSYDDEYAFGEDVVYDIPTITHNIRPKINQWMNNDSKSACTIFGAWSQLIRLFWLDLSREQANEVGLEIIKYCAKKWWYVIGEWWWTPTAVKYVTGWWNEIWYKKYKKDKVFYLRLLWNNSLVKEALSKWHMVWYTKTIQWAWDQIYGYVDKEPDAYNQMTWHRLNLKWPQYITVATWWATQWNAQWWSQDNYFEQIGTNFFIEDLGKYINKWVYAYVYLILPESAMIDTAEEEKKRIAEQKAVDAVIATLTTTRLDLPSWAQKISADYAKKLREEYEDSKPIINDNTIKSATSVVDMLSYNYKFMPEKYQEKFALLAKEMREDFNIK